MNIIENIQYQFKIQSHNVRKATELKNIINTILMKALGVYEENNRNKIISFKPSTTNILGSGKDIRKNIGIYLDENKAYEITITEKGKQ